MQTSLSDTLSEFRGVIFDLDGTLVDLPVDWKGLRKELLGYWQSIGFDGFQEDIEAGLKSIVTEKGPLAFMESLEILRRFEASAVAAAEARSNVVLAASVCADRGQLLGLYTSNLTETAEEALTFIDIRDSFDRVLGRDLVRSQMTSTQGLRTIIEGWRLKPQEVAYVTERNDGAWSRLEGLSVFHVQGSLAQAA